MFAIKSSIAAMAVLLATTVSPAADHNHDKTINLLLGDLKKMYHDDSKSFLMLDGIAPDEFGAKYRAAWPNLAALEGLSLKGHRQLHMLYHEGASGRESFVSFINPNWLPLGAQGPFAYNVGERIKALGKSPGGSKVAAVLLEATNWEAENAQRQGSIPLANPIGHKPTGWHNPHLVYALAVIHQRYPDLRSKTGLKTTLDFWVKDMPEHPDPVRYSENATTVNDHSTIARLYAIAALDLGTKLLGDKRYAQARDAQFKRMSAVLEESGVLKAIRQKKGWRHPRGWAFTRYQRPMTEAASGYGQACALLGDKQGLKQAQDWIVAAMEKSGGKDDPHINYNGATFAERCGMVAVLRGRASMLTPPAMFASPAGRTTLPTWKSLFNGKDLSGWADVNTSPQTWSVRDGLLICKGKPIGVMRSEKQYENFILHIEWRHMQPGGNSGVFVWSDGTPARKRLPKGVEVQMLELDWPKLHKRKDGSLPPVAYVHGEVWGTNGLHTTPDNPRGNRSMSIENRCMPRGQWNYYDVVCVDGVIKLSVNGKFVNGISKATQKKGYLCLESEGAEIHFRNIRILELPPGVTSKEQTAPVVKAKDEK